MNIAIIPARVGSQRIHKKNIKIFRGKPMIAYSIETASKSKNIEKVIVSTDSKEIANIAMEFGALVPFMRGKELSDNMTSTVPVIANAIKMLIELDWEIDNVCCIYPCTPLLKSKSIDNIYELFNSKNEDFAFPVIQYPHPILRALRMLDSGKMEFLFPENELTRTQDLETFYHDAGQFYWGTSNAWLKHKKMHTDGIGVQINPWEAVDIDDKGDWEKAEFLKKLFQ
jgi:pseudaminic acid cytidylyltransferase